MKARKSIGNKAHLNKKNAYGSHTFNSIEETLKLSCHMISHGIFHGLKDGQEAVRNSIFQEGSGKYRLKVQ